MPRLFDVRAGESKRELFGFALLLVLVIAAHTVLETARDTLLLTGPGAKALGAAYMAIAVCTLPFAALVARAGQRFGQRRALAGTLAVGVACTVLLFLAPPSHAAAMVTYVLCGVLSSVAVPQFWTLLGTVMTMSQGRRLFGLVSSGGILGAVLGSAVATAALWVVPVLGLLLVSALGFGLAIAALAVLPTTEPRVPASPRSGPSASPWHAFREAPFLWRVALVVLLSTATFLMLDSLFKSSIARAIPASQVGPFVARYYLVLNGVSLVVQLVVTSAVVRRLGVLPALLIMPLCLVAGGTAAVLGGGALGAVLLVKGIDGGLRYSIHRVSGELVYLPVPASARQRAKPLIDGALVRAVQTATGAGLLALGRTRMIEPLPLAAIVTGLALAWLVTVVTMRRPYVRLLQQVVRAETVDASEGTQPIDLETAQVLVQRLASDDPLEVEGAMTVLRRRNRAGLVPALVLLHHDEHVLAQALEMFAESDRSDWFSLARRLLDDPHENVRIAAARALVRHDQLDVAALSDDIGLRARGYAAVRMALRDESTGILEHPAVRELLSRPAAEAALAKQGMLAAIADADASPRVWPLLQRLSQDRDTSRAGAELLAAAAARQGDRAILPELVRLLASRDGREAIRAALVTFGEPALEEVWRTLRDPTRPRRLRLHMAKTLARFGNRAAAEHLLDEIERETDGLVRYKAIRALRVLVTDHRVSADRTRAERLSALDLEKHLRGLAFRHVLATAPPSGSAVVDELLPELLDEKAAHAAERAFHLLQIAHPRQGVHHAFLAWRSGEPYARATASELLDTLLDRHGQSRLRALFRLTMDDLPLGERVARARSLVAGLPGTAVEAAESLVTQGDAVLAALGRRWEEAHGGRESAVVRSARGGR